MSRAQNIIDFINTLTLPDGRGAGRQFVLRPWQEAIIRGVYDPVDENGRRVCKQALLSIGRKNGKTAIVAALCLAHLCGPEAVMNGQLYSVAFDRDQAAILFKYACAMIRLDEELDARLNIKDSVKEIIDPISGSLYKALSSESRSKHGKSSSFLAFDELAQFGQDRELYDVMMTSTGAHDEALAWVFSTQAANDQALLSELVDYGKRVNDGDLDDPTFKSFIYEIPEPTEEEAAAGYDPVWDESMWPLANPAIGDFRSLDEMRDFAKKAQVMPTAESSFRNLYCNQRVASEHHFLTPSLWKACGSEPDKSALESGKIYAGLDLSEKNDLTSLVICAAVDQEYHIFPFFWVPGDNIREKSKTDRVPYDSWASRGFLEARPGKTIHYGWVAKKVIEFHNKYHIDELKFDRWKINNFILELKNLGCDCYIHDKEDCPGPNALKLVMHGQGFQDMGPAVETLEDLVIESRIRHGNHPVLNWCASNAVVVRDPAGSRKFDKAKSTGRIDGLVALAMALNGAELPELNIKKTSIYETGGVRCLGAI